MIKRQKTTNGGIKLTFALPLDEAPEPTSVTGDFNGWDPLAHPLKKRSNGTRSTSIELQPGEVVRFKYLADGGHWFADADVDVNDDGDNVLAA